MLYDGEKMPRHIYGLSITLSWTVYRRVMSGLVSLCCPSVLSALSLYFPLMSL